MSESLRNEWMNSLRNGFLMKTSEWDVSLRNVFLLEANEWIHFGIVFWLKRVNEMNVSLRNDFLMKKSEWDEWIHFEMIFWWKRVNEMNESLRNSFLMKMNLWMKWIYLQMKTDEWIPLLIRFLFTKMKPNENKSIQSGYLGRTSLIKFTFSIFDVKSISVWINVH